VILNDILNASFLENPYARFVFITLLFYVLSKIVRVFVLRHLKNLAKKSKSKTDDAIIETLEKPIIRFLTLIGLKIGITVLPFSEKILVVLHQIVNSFLIFIAALFLMSIVKTSLSIWGKRWAEKTDSSIDDDLLPLLVKSSNVVFIILGVIFVLKEWNIDVTGLLAGVGIVGLALGFALKDSLANIFGGISIILDKTFKVNDVVKLEDGNMGKIMDIGLRSTKIKTWDNELLIIPNGNLANSTIQNYKKPDLSVRGEVLFGVVYGTDVDKVKKVVTATLKRIPKVIKNDKGKPIQVVFLKMGDFALEFTARFWVKDYNDKFLTKIKATEEIYKDLNKNKIGIPFPTRTLYLRKED
jgi:MscS family membrane protein